jgi:hypothetical protein
MGRRATCFGNAAAESFFATYKKELIRTRPWNGVTEVRQHTFLWIEGYYYRRRRHSTLDYLTPIEYEPGFRKLTDLAAQPVSMKSGTLHMDMSTMSRSAVIARSMPFSICLLRS